VPIEAPPAFALALRLSLQFRQPRDVRARIPAIGQRSFCAVDSRKAVRDEKLIQIFRAVDENDAINLKT
jgi:hypothetical protein